MRRIRMGVLALALTCGTRIPSAVAGPEQIDQALELGHVSAGASVPWTSYAASALVPGSGQWLEGRRETALGHGSAALVTLLLGLYGADQAARTDTAASEGAHLRLAAAVMLSGLAIWSPFELWWASQSAGETVISEQRQLPP